MSTISCQQQRFGHLTDGRPVTCYSLRNANGMAIKLIDYGATLISVQTPDSRGEIQELTLGFEQLDDYLTHDFYFGATIGRVANRIASARFKLADHEYLLTHNWPDYPHHLHGGLQGFDKRLWQTEVSIDRNEASVQFSLTSPDNDQGYPGNLSVQTLYTLTSTNELKITFQAQTDQLTPVDLTNHTYWNLAGSGQTDILGHVLQVWAEQYIVTNQELLPTGALASVKGTPFDFLQPQLIGKNLAQTPDAQGFDVCFVLAASQNNQPRLAARITEPTSGRVLEVYTTQPSLQFYTGNNLTRTPISRGRFAERHGAFCLETQNFPGAVHYSHFPSPFLAAGEQYHHDTIYKLIE